MIRRCQSEIDTSRRNFLTGASLALAASAPLLGFSQSTRDEHRKLKSTSLAKAEMLPFNPEEPFDVRLIPTAGHVDYWRQKVLMQSFDRFGEPKFNRNIDGYAKMEEFLKQGAEELWHRITWKWSTEENRDASGRLLNEKDYPFAKNFSHEAPVNSPGGT